MEIPKIFISDKEETFQYDDDLPSLPLYPLQQTLDRYLESVQPYLDEDEFHQTEFVVEQFGSGGGKLLHEHLMNKSKHSRNWLKKFWEDKAYLELRTPLTPTTNIFAPFPLFNTLWPPEEGTQIKRSALIVWTLLKFWQVLRRQQFVIDKAHGGKVPWTMNQYRTLYNTCRMPGEQSDELHCHFRTEEEGYCPSHLVVLCRGRIFTFDALDEDQEILTAPEIQKQLQYIRDLCDEQPVGPGLCSLTAADRTTWAKHQQHLIQLDPVHQHHLQLIETSLSVVSLDDASPSTFNELGKQTQGGDCTNHYTDKSLTCVVYKNGTAAMNCEHSPCEGMVPLYFTYFSQVTLEAADGEWKGSPHIRSLTQPRELVFHLDNIIYKAIHTSTINFNKAADNIDLCLTKYEGYGRNFIRSHRLNPDTYIQLSLQLNYYKMYGKPAPTYETACVRRYYHGRTETLRSCTVEAIDWAKAMLNENESPCRRLQLFKIAHDKHTELMAAAQQMKGCDRHLLGLYCMAEELGMEIPQLFKDPAYTKSGGGGNYILSTSFLGNTPVYGSIAPMCPHGYGCFYGFQPQMINISLTAWVNDEDTSTKAFHSNLITTLESMRDLLKETKSSNL